MDSTHALAGASVRLATKKFFKDVRVSQTRTIGQAISVVNNSIADRRRARHCGLAFDRSQAGRRLLHETGPQEQERCRFVTVGWTG